MKNIAVFGAGRIGRIHATNVAALPGVSLKFICDPLADAAASLAQALGAQLSTPEAVLPTSRSNIAPWPCEPRTM